MGADDAGRFDGARRQQRDRLQQRYVMYRKVEGGSESKSKVYMRARGAAYLTHFAAANEVTNRIVASPYCPAKPNNRYYFDPDTHVLHAYIFTAGGGRYPQDKPGVDTGEKFIGHGGVAPVVHNWKVIPLLGGYCSW